MEFKIIDQFPSEDDRNVVHLYKRSWDDWFVFSTLYLVQYVNESGDEINIGPIKIGKKGMNGAQFSANKSQERSPDLPETFEQLSSDYFSLGQTTDFYENLRDLGGNLRADILESLNDIAFSEEIYNDVINEEVTRVSLLRDVSETSVVGQFRRLAKGVSKLSSFSFKYTSPKHKDSDTYEINFKVEPKSNPPTNVQVIIGRNGVGKTSLLNGMINSLLEPDTGRKRLSNGYFEIETSDGENRFANLVSVSFSAFDDTEPINEKRYMSTGIRYSYIGLKRPMMSDGKKRGPKSPWILQTEFIDSLEACIKLGKLDIWKDAMRALESDPIFEDSELFNLPRLIETNEEAFKKTARKKFSTLSSGHRIVLLSVTKIVETIEEKSLVLIDEPEGHLHPPLLSAFVRVISNLMVHKNGVAVMATHSPVVLQEVPKSCVWKLSRHRSVTKAEKLNQETFAENVGLLTNEIFGLEVRNSGFHKLILKAVKEVSDFSELMKSFNNELGHEGQAIARTLLINAERNEENS